MARASGSYNGQISGPSAGLRRVRVENITTGLDIIASADSEARSRRAFYPVSTEDSSFSIALAFISWEEREQFNNWMNKFMVAVSEGTAKNGVLTIRCPSRNFIRTGVVQGDLEYGEGLLDLKYLTTLTFIGASDPTNPNLSAKNQGASHFVHAANDTMSRYFYPAGQQISGAEAVDETLFGATADGASFTQIVPNPAKQYVPGQAGQ